MLRRHRKICQMDCAVCQIWFRNRTPRQDFVFRIYRPLWNRNMEPRAIGLDAVNRDWLTWNAARDWKQSSPVSGPLHHKQNVPISARIWINGWQSVESRHFRTSDQYGIFKLIFDSHMLYFLDFFILLLQPATITSEATAEQYLNVCQRNTSGVLSFRSVSGSGSVCFWASRIQIRVQ